MEEIYPGVEHETKLFMGARANGGHLLLAGINYKIAGRRPPWFPHTRFSLFEVSKHQARQCRMPTRRGFRFGMVKQKRYCPHCAERISRSAKRCRICGTYTLPLRYYVTIAFLAVVAIFFIFKTLS